MLSGQGLATVRKHCTLIEPTLVFMDVRVSLQTDILASLPALVVGIRVLDGL